MEIEMKEKKKELLIRKIALLKMKQRRLMEAITINKELQIIEKELAEVEASERALDPEAAMKGGGILDR